ncbi:MAG: hypothetical protein H0T46_23040 [Deltaproteobacteria bacterium]|nr:hypothetical protein [Deltaproteobacteria bacterium]
MLRLLAAASLLTNACDTPKRVVPRDATPDSFVAAIDAPPPSVDAGPPPMMACTAAAPTCALPPSTCLDSRYLVYYTDGSCVSDMCQYTTNVMYCPSGCVNGGCQGGFT